MNKISGNRIISGTHGKVFIDGVCIAECSACQAKITANKDTVQMAGNMMQDTKVSSVKGTGSLTLYKVFSRFAEYAKSILEGKDLRATIISAVEDPDAYGFERVMLLDVSFDEYALQNWETGKAQSDTVPFTFGGYQNVDTIAVR